MTRWSVLIGLILLACVALPHRSPAPLIYTPGVGWTYEPVGKEGKWHRTRAREQLEVAKQAFEEEEFKTARKAAARTVKHWPLSDYAAEAQYLVGRSYEEMGRDEKAFKEYQEVLEKHPKFERYDEVLKRQYEIANKYLDGKWFRLWGYIPIFPSMDKTAEMYRKIIEKGPYSEVAPSAQMKIGEAYEKQEDFASAVRALEKAADKYHDNRKIAADALFRAGLAHEKQAKEAEYDQNAASQAINTLTDFTALYPEDERVDEAAQIIQSLRTEQARGAYKIAKFYEKKKKWSGALVYYNEVVLKDPESSYAVEAKERIAFIKDLLAELDKIRTGSDN